MIAPTRVGQTTRTFAASLAMLCACTSAPVQASNATYPLPICGDDSTGDCRAPFFADSEKIAPRTPEAFPRRYLELWSEEARAAECSEDASCIKRLERLNDYFNPLGKPNTGKIGIALEGGGNKSAPFSLGVLAGINQMGLWDRIGAIGSVSGGTYAASFYFNRMLDLYNVDGPPPTPEQLAQMRDAWFASCIPDALSDGRRYFDNLSQIKRYLCGELANPNYAFDGRYQYQQQVWMHPDVLRLANDVPGDPDQALHLDDIGNLLALAGLTVMTVPYQFVARTIFRWPVNSSPSRFAYRVGLEREYGYSPKDWQSALTGDTPIWWNTLHLRRGTRTLTTLADKIGTSAPTWIILSTAPGHIDALAWAKPAPRDPIRQQFEITPTGFGSGTYGYARANPDAPFDFFGAKPNGLPIIDAVLASAAFFDDNEIEVSKQPLRFLGGAAQQFGNVDWYSEVRNFNVSDSERKLEWALPWPLYLLETVRQSKTPYIHLQDGGNAENAGILALLRRGYRRIVYAHGTTDTEAQLPAICHLKNQFEFDGNYYIVSQDLQDLVGDHDSQVTSPIPDGEFLNYLDQLCSQQIDASDLAAFDANELREEVPQRARAVAKVFCGRIGSSKLDEVAYPQRAQPDAGYQPCEEYTRRFRYSVETGMQGGIALTFPLRRALFYQTSATPLRFHVCRGDALANTDAARGRRKQDLKMPLSTIIAVVPAMAWKDVAAQINPIEAPTDRQEWGTVCAASAEERRRIVFRECQAPDASRLAPMALTGATPEQLLPCAALAHVLENTCKSTEQGGVDIPHPTFPQDDLVRLTLHIPYPTYAAYFDLGRAQVHRALGPQFGDKLDDDDENACAIPTARADRKRTMIQNR